MGTPSTRRGETKRRSACGVKKQPKIPTSSFPNKPSCLSGPVTRLRVGSAAFVNIVGRHLSGALLKQARRHLRGFGISTRTRFKPRRACNPVATVSDVLKNGKQRWKPQTTRRSANSILVRYGPRNFFPPAKSRGSCQPPDARLGACTEAEGFRNTCFFHHSRAMFPVFLQQLVATPGW